MTTLSDDNQARKDFIAKKWREFGRFQHDLMTQDLPDDVVGPDLNIYVGSYSDPEDGRKGVIQTAFRYDGKDNPDLTPQQAEYVIAVMLGAARIIEQRFIPGEK